MDYKTEIALEGFELGAFDFNPYIPFTWSSGHKMPIKISLQRLLFLPKTRNLISTGFKDLIRENNIFFEMIAGISDSGISPATTLSDSLSVPLFYVKENLPNNLEKEINEGFITEGETILMKDFIFTGAKSVKAINSIRSQNIICNKCISIFDCSLAESEKAFKELNPSCKVYSLLNYDSLLKTATEQGYVLSDTVESLLEWKKNPFSWGEKNGFPRIKK